MLLTPVHRPGRIGNPSMNELVDLVKGRPGWRLEPVATPGSAPTWCFGSGRKIELSATAERDVIHLFVVETDEEIEFKNADELAVWLRANWAEALQEPKPRLPMRSRLRKITGWS
jgi:hypothetical protein